MICQNVSSKVNIAAQIEEYATVQKHGVIIIETSHKKNKLCVYDNGIHIFLSTKSLQHIGYDMSGMILLAYINFKLLEQFIIKR